MEEERATLNPSGLGPGSDLSWWVDDITYIWTLINGTNEPIYRKETNLWTWRLVVAKGEGEGVGWTGSLC